MATEAEVVVLAVGGVATAAILVAVFVFLAMLGTFSRVEAALRREATYLAQAKADAGKDQRADVGRGDERKRERER